MLVACLIGAIVGGLFVAVAYEHSNFNLQLVANQSPFVHDLLSQVGYPLKDAQTLEKEQKLAEIRKKRGHEVYMVKGEILYKFGLLFKKWSDSMQRVQDVTYTLIEKAEVLA